VDTRNISRPPPLPLPLHHTFHRVRTTPPFVPHLKGIKGTPNDANAAPKSRGSSPRTCQVTRGGAPFPRSYSDDGTFGTHPDTVSHPKGTLRSQSDAPAICWRDPTGRHVTNPGTPLPHLHVATHRRGATPPCFLHHNSTQGSPNDTNADPQTGGNNPRRCQGTAPSLHAPHPYHAFHRLRTTFPRIYHHYGTHASTEDALGTHIAVWGDPTWYPTWYPLYLPWAARPHDADMSATPHGVYCTPWALFNTLHHPWLPLFGRKAKASTSYPPYVSPPTAPFLFFPHHHHDLPFSSAFTNYQVHEHLQNYYWDCSLVRRGAAP
jgi:hypothetical protein